MVENIRDFLRRFTEEELEDRGVLQGQAKLLRETSIDHLIALMKEHNVDKLEFPERNWFLDADYNFNNPRSLERATNVYQLSMRGEVFRAQNRHVNPYFELPEPEPNDEVESLITEAKTITFGLERDLQAVLRANIDQLEHGLRITDGGKERTVAAGRIDITAEDREGKLVVIELKAGAAKPESLAQVLAYMASLESEEQKPVRGILVAGDFHDRVVLASRKVPDLQLKQYSFSFSFSDR
jgi:hypothetical protein